MADKLARFPITHEMLAQMLMLPVGTRIVRVREHPTLHHAAEIMVECDEFQEVEDGATIPVMCPWYKTVG